MIKFHPTKVKQWIQPRRKIRTNKYLKQSTKQLRAFKVFTFGNQFSRSI